MFFSGAEGAGRLTARTTAGTAVMSMLDKQKGAFPLPAYSFVTGTAVMNIIRIYMQVALYWACPLTSRRKTKKHTKKHVVSITTSQGDYKICLLKSAPFKLKITLIHSLSKPPVVEHASANVQTVDPRVTCRDCILAAID